MSVYFIQSGAPGGHIKIGYTSGSALVRMAALQTGNPTPLRLLLAVPDDIASERDLHVRFAELREKGEWFRPDRFLLGFIDGLRARSPSYEDQVALDEENEIETLGCTERQARGVCGYMAANALRRSFEVAASRDTGEHGGSVGFWDECDATSFLDAISIIMDGMSDDHYASGVLMVLSEDDLLEYRDRVSKWFRYVRDKSRKSASAKKWSPDVLELLEYNHCDEECPF